MGSEVLGPGADAPGSAHAAGSAAYAWAIAAADAAVRLPASNAEAAAWTVRGWADVAVGCLALDGSAPAGSGGPAPSAPGAFGGLDEVVRAMPVVSGGQHAARLRRLRKLAGPVPPWYPNARPVAGPVRSVGPFIWPGADLLARFGEDLMMTGARLPWGASCPLSSARQLAWGARYRPSPSDAHRTVRLPVNRFLARRTWMCLPGTGPGPSKGSGSGPGPAVAEVPSTASPLAQQIWRGIHEGAHLDHLAALTALGAAAPSPAEFGAGLLIAESYAMAVEILAAVECVLAEEGHAVWQLGAGLIERATRLPGGSAPAPEFTHLPTLAEVYVRGPLEVLTGGDAARALPEQIVGSLRARWRSACAAYPPADVFASAAAELLGRSHQPPCC
ncbi:MAG: hypothetical protein WAL72_10710 [Streptosporangiaceae bacterium]